MCRSCVSAGLRCTYNNIPQKKGPRGSRANVLHKLRRKQQLPDLGGGGNYHLPGLLTTELREQCVNLFFAEIYPLQPVLGPQQVCEAMVNMNWSIETYCMVLALCACTMIQARTRLPFTFSEPSETSRHTAHVLLQESRRLWKAHDYSQKPTYHTVLTSWFYYKCYLALGDSDAAWCRLREATTQVLLLRMHEEETYGLDPLAPQKRVLYWMFFIAER